MTFDTPFALSLLLLGCAAAHELPEPTPDAGTPMSDSGTPSDRGPCPPGWVSEPGACARWTEAAPYPAERCEPGTTAEPAISPYGSPMVRCGELGFVYSALTDDWREEPGGTFDPQDWDEVLPRAEPGGRRLVAPLWGDRLLLLRRAPGSDRWEASRVDFVGEDTQSTAPPPSIEPVALLPLGSAMAIAAGPERSAVYERIVR